MDKSKLKIGIGDVVFAEGYGYGEIAGYFKDATVTGFKYEIEIYETSFYDNHRHYENYVCRVEPFRVRKATCDEFQTWKLLEE
jgi:hypothetical protein